MTMRAPAVSIANLRKTFPGASQPALAGVSINIRQNEFFTLLGPSGCGKTTLLRMIAGFEVPDAGEILLDGVAMGLTPPNRRPVNTVFQSYALFPHMSVAQNIAFGLEMLGRPRDSIGARVAEMMRLLRLDGLGYRRPNQLSGGQQQRVALGRALAPEPKVLLLDEPLSALDLKLRREMQIELKRLQSATGITFIFVTHDQEEALTMSDRVAVMRSGEVMQVGEPHEVYVSPANLFVADFVGEANLIPAICTDRNGAGGRFRIEGAANDDATIGVDNAGDVRPGQKAALMVRPEHVSLARASGGLRARATAAAYNGSDVMLHADLDGGATLRLRVPGGAAGVPAAGETISVVIPPNAVRVFAS